DLYHKELIERRKAPTIWCSECGTAIAQAELDDLERESTFFTLAFGLKDGTTLPIATTRPELLPACVAVFTYPGDERFQDLVGQQATVPLFGQTVPLLEDKLIFSPALMEDTLFENDLSEYKINETIGKTFLPLPSGLIGLGKNTYLIKHNDYFNTHIAATVDFRNKRVGFLQDCPPSQLKSRWKFSFIKGSKESVIKRANQLNVHPRILL
ncbi:MAG: hypothetical protein ACFFCS_04710, partial [Candidatus Hodarchaeota archaeon]